VHRGFILLVLCPKSDELRDRPRSIGWDRHLGLWSRSGLSDYCHFEGAGKLRCLYMIVSKSTNKASHRTTTRIRGVSRTGRHRRTRGDGEGPDQKRAGSHRSERSSHVAGPTSWSVFDGSRRHPTS
jgi:hypothetical protein